MIPHKSLLLLLPFFTVGLLATEPASFEGMLPGYCHAGNENVDPLAMGGYAGSENLPKQLDSSIEPKAAALYLELLPEEKTLFAEKYEGIVIRLVNGSKEKRAIPASDSRISIVQEAKDEQGHWTEIEYLANGWCGNSYHNVYLNPREYWSFSAPRYSGPQKTSLRFKLVLSEDLTLYSEEYEGGVHPQQISKQPGHGQKKSWARMRGR